MNNKIHLVISVFKQPDAKLVQYLISEQEIDAHGRNRRTFY
jgi:hypothetical protein